MSLSHLPVCESNFGSRSKKKTKSNLVINGKFIHKIRCRSQAFQFDRAHKIWWESWGPPLASDRSPDQMRVIPRFSPNFILLRVIPRFSPIGDHSQEEQMLSSNFWLLTKIFGWLVCVCVTWLITVKNDRGALTSSHRAYETHQFFFLFRVCVQWLVLQTQ